MIALIVIGAIWAVVFVFTSLVGFFEATDVSGTLSIHMGEYAWMVSKSIWFLVASLPGFIMMFSGIVGKALSSELKDIKSKSEKIKKTLSEMTDEELKAQRKEMMK